MKRFRILGILAILVIVGDFAISFTAGWQEERDSFWREVKVPVRKHQPYTRLKVSLWRYDLWKQRYWIHCAIIK